MKLQIEKVVTQNRVNGTRPRSIGLNAVNKTQSTYGIKG